MWKPLFIVSVGCLAVQSTIHAGVLTNPALYTGAVAIDPTGGEELDFAASGATAQATLEARSDFYAVHTFHNTATDRFITGDSTNYISFTDASLPDVRVTAELGAGPSVNGASGTANINTSTGSAIYLGNGAMRWVIDFGSYNSGVFTSNMNAVEAAGFALVRSAVPASPARKFTVEFKDDSGNILSTQTYTDSMIADTTTNGTGDDVYFGYQIVPGQQKIGSIVLRMTNGDGALLGVNTAIDDLGFTTVPEPASLGLLALGLGMMSTRQRK